MPKISPICYNDFKATFFFGYNRFFKKEALYVLFYDFPKKIAKANGLTRNEVLMIATSDQLQNEKTRKAILTHKNLSEILQTLFPKNEIYLRINSECFLSWFGEGHCECEETKNYYLSSLAQFPQAMFFHLPQEGKGRGLPAKMIELHLQYTGRDQNNKIICEGGCDHITAYQMLHKTSSDGRDYKIISYILRKLGLENKKYLLLSNNPNKLKSLKDLQVELFPLPYNGSAHNIHNLGEFLQKHILSNQRIPPIVNDVIKVLSITNYYLPQRVTTLLKNSNKGQQTKHSVEYESLLLTEFDLKDFVTFLSRLATITKDIWYGVETTLEFPILTLKKYSLTIRQRFSKYLLPRKNILKLFLAEKIGPKQHIYNLSQSLSAFSLLSLTHTTQPPLISLYPIISFTAKITGNNEITANIKVGNPTLHSKKKYPALITFHYNNSQLEPLKFLHDIMPSHIVKRQKNSILYKNEFYWNEQKAIDFISNIIQHRENE